MKESIWEVHWINGHSSAKATTLIKAVRKMKFRSKNIESGLLVKVRNKGITSYWDSRKFQKYARLVEV